MDCASGRPQDRQTLRLLDRPGPSWLGKHLDEINGALISEITKARRKQGVTDATIKRDLFALSSVMNIATDENYRDDDPVLPRLERIKERRDPIVLPRPEQVAKVIAMATGLFSKMIAAARATGARKGESAGASHLHLDRKAKRLTRSANATSCGSLTWSPSEALRSSSRYPRDPPMLPYSGTARAAL